MHLPETEAGRVAATEAVQIVREKNEAELKQAVGAVKTKAKEKFAEMQSTIQQLKSELAEATAQRATSGREQVQANEAELQRLKHQMQDQLQVVQEESAQKTAELTQALATANAQQVTLEDKTAALADAVARADQASSLATQLREDMQARYVHLLFGPIITL